MRTRRIAAAASILCLVGVQPAPVLAHGGGVGGGVARGAAAFRAVGPRAFPFRHPIPFFRHAAPASRFHRHGWGGWRRWNGWGGWGGWGGAAIAPLMVLPEEPAGYGERFGEPRPPVMRECQSETRMVPSSEHAGLTPVAVIRCWRRY